MKDEIAVLKSKLNSMKGLSNENDIIELQNKYLKYVENYEKLKVDTNYNKFNKAYSEKQIALKDEEINEKNEELNYLKNINENLLSDLYTKITLINKSINNKQPTQRIITELKSVAKNFDVNSFELSEDITKQINSVIIDNRKIEADHTLQLNSINNNINYHSGLIDSKINNVLNEINSLSLQVSQMSTLLDSLSKDINGLIVNQNLKIDAIKKDNEIYRNSQNIKSNVEFDLIYNLINNQNLMNAYYSGNYRTFKQKLISKIPSIFILKRFKQTGFKNALKTIKGYKAIKKNNLFDIPFYLKNNPDLVYGGHDPLLDYIYRGEKSGEFPNKNFDPKYFRSQHKDMPEKLNALVYYALYNQNRNWKIKLDNNKKIKKDDYSFNYELIKNSGLFDSEWYLKTYGDVKKLNINPIEHYIKHGYKEGREPNKYFNTKIYTKQHFEIKDTNEIPLIHFILSQNGGK